MSVFGDIVPAPPDSILGLTEAFRADSNPQKINLGVGIYQDGKGQTPVLATVKEAEARLLREESSKGYLPIAGPPAFGTAVRRLLFGAEVEGVDDGRAFTAQTPGGTGALRVAGDFIARALSPRRVWLSDPTWANHPQIFAAAGLEVSTYRWLDRERHTLDLDGLLADLRRAEVGDVVLLHACCHNPSGVDPDAAAWEAVADVLVERSLLPLFDFAYQGFGDGLEADAGGLRCVLGRVPEALVASSFSKNFGLYRERVGALTLLATDGDAAARAASRVKVSVRSNYSNPPSHGGAVVTTVLEDPELRRQWEAEVDEMRSRIHSMRRLMVEKLAALGTRDFGFLLRQRGMFSASGLTKGQVTALRERHAIYAVDSGRINVAAVTESNVDRLCEAIADVLSD